MNKCALKTKFLNGLEYKLKISSKLLLTSIFTISLTACGGGSSNGVTPPATISATATSTSQNLTVGTAMTSFQPLTASGGSTPYTYSVTTGSLPLGLSLNASTGAITGAPTSAYPTANVVISVRDAHSVVASTASTVSFSVIDATANTSAQYLNVAKTMLSFTPLTASGGAPPYTYSISAGSLPLGLVLDANTGSVTGTPTTTYSTASVTFSVKDANNTVAARTSIVNLTVMPAGYVIQSGVIWMPATFSDTWANADTYCANTAINGLTGWRLPTFTELLGLYSSGAMNGQGWTVSATWSSPSVPMGFNYVNLTDGTNGYGSVTGYSFLVTCVHLQ